MNFISGGSTSLRYTKQLNLNGYIRENIKGRVLQIMGISLLLWSYLVGHPPFSNQTFTTRFDSRKTINVEKWTKRASDITVETTSFHCLKNQTGFQMVQPCKIQTLLSNLNKSVGCKLNCLRKNYSDELAYVQVVIKCRYSMAQMWTLEDILARYFRGAVLDDVMSQNELITAFIMTWLNGMLRHSLVTLEGE